MGKKWNLISTGSEILATVNGSAPMLRVVTVSAVMAQSYGKGLNPLDDVLKHRPEPRTSRTLRGF
jgi:hypothetical protein